MTGSSLAYMARTGATGRFPRRPTHTFQLKTKPWQIAPFLLAPVLPGETLKNLLLQARVVTAPIANPLVGWWTEYYLFYCKLRDLDARDELTQMILTPGYDLSALFMPAKAKHYHAGGNIDFVSMCLDRVVAEYFRNEGEAVGAYMLDGLPCASISRESWLDSASFTTPAVLDHELPGENPALPAHMAGWEAQYAQWEHMRALKLTEATFEDWLRSFGVKAPKPEETHKPELLRYVRDWTYPTNTVDPATGVPSSACSWAIAERVDKDRFFAEPGFVFGVSVTRPKVYFGRQRGTAAAMLTDAFAWLPAVLSDEPYTSLRKFSGNPASLNGPLQAMTGSADYWVDLRDLFLYGDQFLNYDPAAVGSKVELPTAGMQSRYASLADADALFTGSDSALKVVRQDGVATFNILGRQVDHT